MHDKRLCYIDLLMMRIISRSCFCSAFFSFFNIHKYIFSSYVSKENRFFWENDYSYWPKSIQLCLILLLWGRGRLLMLLMILGCWCWCRSRISIIRIWCRRLPKWPEIITCWWITLPSCLIFATMLSHQSISVIYKYLLIVSKWINNFAIAFMLTTMINMLNTKNS